MVNPFLMNPRERLQSWKDLRAGLTAELTDEQHLSDVARFWGQAPIKQQFMDYLDPETWPDAWSMIDSCDMDQNMLSLGMLHTLLLAADQRWTGRLELLMIRRPDDSIERLVLIAGGRWCLNLWHGTVCDWPLGGRTNVMHRFVQTQNRRISMKEVETDLAEQVNY